MTNDLPNHLQKVFKSSLLYSSVENAFLDSATISPELASTLLLMHSLASDTSIQIMHRKTISFLVAVEYHIASLPDSGSLSEEKKLIINLHEALLNDALLEPSSKSVTIGTAQRVLPHTIKRFDLVCDITSRALHKVVKRCKLSATVSHVATLYGWIHGGLAKGKDKFISESNDNVPKCLETLAFFSNAVKIASVLVNEFAAETLDLFVKKRQVDMRVFNSLRLELILNRISKHLMLEKKHLLPGTGKYCRLVGIQVSLCDSLVVLVSLVDEYIKESLALLGSNGSLKQRLLSIEEEFEPLVKLFDRFREEMKPELTESFFEKKQIPFKKVVPFNEFIKLYLENLVDLNIFYRQASVARPMSTSQPTLDLEKCEKLLSKVVVAFDLAIFEDENYLTECDQVLCLLTVEFMMTVGSTVGYGYS